MRHPLAALALFATAFGTAAAQEDTCAQPQTIDALISATYDVISGPVGQDRDWDCFRTLFIKDATMMSRGYSEPPLQPFTPEQYIERSGPWLVENGFTEREIHRVTHQYGAVAQIFSSYEGYREGQDEPIMRGINSFQVAMDKDGWRIVSLVWQQENEILPLPAQYGGEKN